MDELIRKTRAKIMAEYGVDGSALNDILREFAGKVQVDAIKAYQEFEAAMKDSRDYLKHIHGQGPIAHATDSYNAAKKRATDAR